MEQSFQIIYLYTMARNKEFDPEERLEKARDLFWEKGYHATSMQDLVEAMELNRGSIYDTYGDKHALFMQCLSHYSREKLKDYKQAAAGTRSPMKAVENIIRRAVSRTLEEGKTCMVVKSSFELAAADKDVHAALKQQTAELVGVIEALLIKAQEAGELPAGRDAGLVANFVVSSFSGLWQTQLITGNNKLVNQLADYLVLMIRK